MKKQLIYVLSVMLVFGALGCKKPPLPRPDENNTENTEENNEEEEEQPSPYVGTWDYTEILLSNGTLSFMNNNAGTFTGTGSSIVGSVVLTENPNRYTTNLVFTADLNVTFFGQTQQQSVPVDPQSSSGTWTENNGQISLQDDNGNPIGVISSTANRIVFTGNFSQQLQFGQQFALDANADVQFTIEK